MLPNLGKEGISIYPTVYAKLLQLCPTLCEPMDQSPPGSSVPLESQFKLPLSSVWTTPCLYLFVFKSHIDFPPSILLWNFKYTEILKQVHCKNLYTNHLDAITHIYIGFKYLQFKTIIPFPKWANFYSTLNNTQVLCNSLSGSTWPDF